MILDAILICALAALVWGLLGYVMVRLVHRNDDKERDK